MTTGMATGDDGRILSDADAHGIRNSHPSEIGQLRTTGFRVSDAEVEAILASFQDESYSEKTWSRLLVENYLQYVSRFTIRRWTDGPWLAVIGRCQVAVLTLFVCVGGFLLSFYL
jgi:hypothetical protein